MATIHFFQPCAELREVVSRIYTHFADSVFAPPDPSWLIVPDGEIKLIFPSSGEISCVIDGRHRRHSSSRLIVSGMRTAPGTLQFHGRVEAIGVIIRPESAYRLFDMPLDEIADCTLDGEEVFGALGRFWEEQLLNLTTMEARVAALQRQLVGLLCRRQRRDPIYEFAVRRLQNAEGFVRIESLAQQTGYSRRTIERRFLERAGVGAKTLEEIVRFHCIYRQLRHPAVRYIDLIDNLYYDQAHFLKAFKRFTGTTPRSYATTEDFGRLYIPNTN